MNGKNKKISPAAMLIFAVIIAITAIVFLLIAGGPAYKSKAGNRDEISENVKELKKLEERDPQAHRKQEESAAAKTQITDLEAEKDKVMAVTVDNYDPDALRRWFEGTVILGDSLTMAAQEYGFLGNDVICAAIGVSLEGSDGLLEEAVARYPRVVFLCFGMNDIENYGADYQSYINQCREKTDYLKSVLPGVQIYLHSVLPVDPASLDVNSWGVYQQQYNAAIEQLCNELEDVTYIDTSFILERDPSLYEPDGIHPVGAFYPKWLTYFADIAGLSDN